MWVCFVTCSSPEVICAIFFFFLKWWDSIQKHDYSLWMGKKANAPANRQNGPWHSSLGDLRRPVLHRRQFWHQHPVLTTTLIREDNSKWMAFGGFQLGEICSDLCLQWDCWPPRLSHLSCVLQPLSEIWDHCDGVGLDPHWSSCPGGELPFLRAVP